MRIIFLNTYGGHLKQKLFDFVLSEKDRTDIFCLQEVSITLQQELNEILPDFTHIFEEGFMLSDVNEMAGQSIVFTDKFKVVNSEKILLHELKTKDIGFLLKAVLETNGQKLCLGNVHGTSTPWDKLDTDLRIGQSEIILNSFKESAPRIIGGDFNLLRTTKSVQAFEQGGFTNLITGFNVSSTRNKVAWERFKNDPGFVKQYDSDFCFVSKGIIINDFEVPSVEVSDHEPLILDFELS
jgi:endonuclease/exonuclease/phosphatase family metal-dependent hydrolase